MKKSTAVTLVISGALMAGCDNRPNWSSGNGDAEYSTNGVAITNNTYVPGQGYWHAPYGGWYPYPFNYYRAGYGYYHGGNFSSEPEVYHAPSISTGHWGGSSGGRIVSGGGHFASVGIARGGFGSSAHGSGS
jgi:hypothetical protein